MGTRERRQRQREGTRDKILQAARDLFLERSYEGVTMRAIADAIEYTPTAIYHHFENKQSLLGELCRSDFADLGRHFVRAAAVADPIERIRAVGEAYLEFAERYPNHYRFMFMTSVPVEHSEEYLAENRDDPEKDAYAFFRRSCQDAIDTGRLRPDIDDADELAQMLWAALHGLISLHVLKQNQAWVPLRDLKQTARRTMDLFFRGVLKPDTH